MGVFRNKKFQSTVMWLMSAILLLITLGGLYARFQATMFQP